MNLIFKKNISLAIGAFIMLNIFGCSGVKFNKYISKDSQINLSMDYISGWQYNETRGSLNSYAQVMFFQFKKGQKSSRAIMELTVKDASRMQPAALSLDAAAGDLLEKRMKFKDAKLLSKSTMRLLNTDAIAMELSYLTLENLLNVKSKLISIKEKIIIFQLKNNFYFLRYENSGKEFDKYNSAFMHMVKTAALNH